MNLLISQGCQDCQSGQFGQDGQCCQSGGGGFWWSGLSGGCIEGPRVKHSSEKFRGPRGQGKSLEGQRMSRGRHRWSKGPSIQT